MSRSLTHSIFGVAILSDDGDEVRRWIGSGQVPAEHWACVAADQTGAREEVEAGTVLVRRGGGGDKRPASRRACGLRGDMQKDPFDLSTENPAAQHEVSHIGDLFLALDTHQAGQTRVPEAILHAKRP